MPDIMAITEVITVTAGTTVITEDTADIVVATVDMAEVRLTPSRHITDLGGLPPVTRPVTETFATGRGQ